MPFGFFLSLYRWHFPHSVLFGFVLNQKIHPDYECLYAATILCKATSNTHTHTHIYIYINKIQVYKYITTQSIAAIRIIIELSNSPAQTTHRHRNLYGTSTVLGFFADSFSWQLAMYSGWLQRWHITILSWMLLKFPLSPWEKDVFLILCTTLS